MSTALRIGIVGHLDLSFEPHLLTRSSLLQLYVAVGLSTTAVITSLVVSLFRIGGIRGDIRELAVI
jgi:hypothetical protein